MSRADQIFIDNIKDILSSGFSDEGLEVRPHWSDGTPAHTVKKFGLVNRYDLRGVSYPYYPPHLSQERHR